MALPTRFIDYSSRDFEDIKGSLVEYVRTWRPRDFTDFTESQLGLVLLEWIAYVGDMLSLNLDVVSNEVFLQTATQRDSVIKHCALLGYKLKSSSASSCALNLNTNRMSTFAEVVIVPGGQLAGAGSVAFEVLRDYTLQRVNASPPYAWMLNGVDIGTQPYVPAVQGRSRTDIRIAVGGAFQRYQMSDAPYINDSMALTVGGVRWVLVDSMALGDPNDPFNRNIYELAFDQTDRPTVLFGSGTGLENIPQIGDEIRVVYRVGGGSQGNLTAGALTGSLHIVTGGAGVQVPYVSTEATGGVDRESIEQAKLYAPAWARTMDRAITERDYLALSNGYTDGQTGYVAKAGVIADPTDGISNVVTIYAWVEDAQRELRPINPFAPALAQSLWEFLDARRCTSVYLSPIQDGTNVAVPISIMIRIGIGYEPDVVQAEVRNVIRNLFFSDRVRVGNELRVSWIYDVVSDVGGVEWSHLLEPDPDMVRGSIIEIAAGVASVAQPDPLTGARIPGPVGLAADFYSNLYIIINGQSNRIFRSTAVSGGTTDLTLAEEWLVPLVGSEPFRIVHPRMVRLQSTDDDFLATNLVNRVIVLEETLEGYDSQTRGIVSYNPTSSIAVVDEAWPPLVYPTQGELFMITKDYKCISSRALVLGTLEVSVVN